MRKPVCTGTGIQLREGLPVRDAPGGRSQRKKFNMWEFFKEMATGGLTGGKCTYQNHGNDKEGFIWRVKGLLMRKC